MGIRLLGVIKEELEFEKKIDRAMVNDKWLDKMSQTTLNHLPSV